MFVKYLVDIGLPVVLFLMMVVVGTGLSLDEIRLVARQPRHLALATLGQVVLLPAIALMLTRVLDLTPEISGGILLVFACPAGTMSNVHTYVARANVALSVSLTAASCLAGLVTLPLILAGYRILAAHHSEFDVPVLTMIGQLLCMLVAPITAGMVARHFQPRWTARCAPVLFGIGVCALVAMIVFLFLHDQELFTAAIMDTIACVALLTAISLGVGYALEWMFGGKTADRLTLGNVFAVRNVGIATVVAVTILNHVDFAIFATAYFVVQTPLILAVALAHRIFRTEPVQPFVEVESETA